MDLSLLTQYVSPLILIACSGICYSLHSLNNKILNSFLPIISGAIGIVAAVWYFNVFDFPTVVTGMISGLASTGMYEAFKNMLNLPATYQAAAIEIPYGESSENADEDDESKGRHAA